MPLWQKMAEEHADVALHFLTTETRNAASVKKWMSRYAVLSTSNYVAGKDLVESFFSGMDATLPATFVFDKQGDLARTYFRPVTENELNTVFKDLAEEILDADYLIRQLDFSFQDEVLRITLVAKLLHLSQNQTLSLNVLKRLLVLSQYFGWEKEVHEVLRQRKMSQKDSEVILEELARYANSQRIYDLSVLFLDALHERRPEKTEYLERLGRIHMENTQYEMAQRSFGALTQIKPQQADYWLSKAEAGRLAKKKNVILDYQRVLKIEPNNPRALEMVKKLSR